MVSIQRALQHTYLPLLVKMETWRDSAEVTWSKSTRPQMSLVLPHTLWNSPTQPTPQTVSTLQFVRDRLATEMQEPQLEMETSGGWGEQATSPLSISLSACVQGQASRGPTVRSHAPPLWASPPGPACQDER